MFPRLLVSLVLLVAWAALPACGDDSSMVTDSSVGTDGDTPDVAVPDGFCPATVTFRATGSTPDVHIAGPFNDWDETADRMVDDGTGVYRVTLALTPGVHPYKFFVEGDGREPWRLDPDNAYRAYDSGEENSGLRVADCRVPGLTVDTATGVRGEDGVGRIDATVRYDRRLAGPADMVTAELRSGRSTRALDGAEVTVAGDVITVAVTGLAEGKHTVRISAIDTAGVEAESVLLPVWIEAEPFEWRDALIYMILTDRFKNGDATNDGEPTMASPGAEWDGGDLEGVKEAIESGYLDRLGVSALWLTPFNDNPDVAYADADDFHSVAGYHGYWPVDARAVDPRLGGEEALDELVAVAHEHGIRILMDLVVNHVHEDHPYYRDHPTWFNTGCICGTGGCDWTERRLDCLFRDYMPDLNWEVTDASEQVIEDSLYWLERFDLDGFRVDAVKHVVDGAIFNLGMRVRERFETAGTEYFLMGETAQGWDSSSGPTEGGNPGNYDIISRYITPDGLDGQFDFVLYYAASLQFLGDTPGRGMAHVDFWTQASMERYPRGAVMTPYIGSHDTQRFLTLQAHPGQANNKWDDLPTAPDWDEPYDRMYVALAWLLAIPGAPLLYYGDEYGEFGGADPDNRHVMRFDGALNTREQNQLDRVSRLGRARADLVGLRRGAYRTLQADDDLWVVARGEGEDLVLVVVNRGAAPRAESIPVPADVAAEGRSFVDALAGGATPTVERAAITLTIPGRSALYLH
ncbi:MAG: glycosyl hydrolase [Deltaproteobacteria bacterium]|nr:MAG: glycosyl hydrolase [Deltaproteobacteria bacterium]